MVVRYGLVAAALAVAAVLIWHPAHRLAVKRAAATASPFSPEAAPSADAFTGRPHRQHGRFESSSGELVVYVAGAVKRPGLYHLRPGDRVAQALALAGGFTGSADAAAVNLAQRAGDGDEVYVPVVGETVTSHSRSSERHGRRRPSHTPPAASVDINGSDASELAAVPGIGRAIAARIVELREREGSFASLDELLDVAGMTQTRLERARPYLRQP